ncbi:MAG: tyrosine-type recombinase/integrase, partial [Candidatus Dormibacteraeota bacterium]|nr:tyrosine-type recombinase/integrase [Candidatus Dormibacteraeota bacterium]
MRGESEPRGRDLSAGELRGLLEACARAPQAVMHRQDSVTRRRRDAAFLSLLYGSGLRRAEAVALELADLDQVTGQLRVRQGKGRRPRPVSLPTSALPALQDWLLTREASLQLKELQERGEAQARRCRLVAYQRPVVVDQRPAGDQ